MKKKKTDLESATKLVLEVATDFSKRKKLRELTEDNIKILATVLAFYSLDSDMNPQTYALDQFLEGSVTSVTLTGTNGKFVIDNPEVIRQILWKIKPYTDHLGLKRKRGQPKSKLYGVIHYFRNPLNRLRQQEIPLEFLYELFNSISEENTSDFDSFKKTFAAAIKDPIENHGKELAEK